MPTGLIYRDMRYRSRLWKRCLLVASMRAKPAFVIPCFMGRAQALLLERRFQEAADFLLACASRIQKVVKTDYLDFSQDLQVNCSEAADCLGVTVFKSITQPCETSLSDDMLKKVFESFHDFLRITQHKLLPDLLCLEEDVRKRAVEIAKVTSCASQDMAYLLAALIAEHEKRWLDALRLFSQCRGHIKDFAVFRMACIILDGKAGKKNDGMRMLEGLRNAGYPPAIIYWLQQLLSRAYTPEGIRVAFHKLVQCPGWEKFMPDVKWRLLAKLNHQIKLIKARLESWVKALKEQEDRAFLHTLLEKCPPQSELAATEGRIEANKKSVEAHQKEVAEAQSIYDALRSLYEAEKKAAEKKKRDETNVGGKRKKKKMNE